jgi:hypothetical protein
LKQELKEKLLLFLSTHAKRISACDESAGTLGKRFEAVGVVNTEGENRRKYRQMLLRRAASKNICLASFWIPKRCIRRVRRMASQHEMVPFDVHKI